MNETVPPTKTKTKAQPSRNNLKLTRQHWVDAARDVLVKEGIMGISLRRLAQSLNATTGAFYWQYNQLDELLEDLRQDWVNHNTKAFDQAIAAAGADGWRQYLAYVKVLLDEKDYNPRYDNAIRDWAHSSHRTAVVLQDNEAIRIEQLRQIFLALGFVGRAALIRARVTYFSQTGYTAMNIHEPLEERLLNIPYYAEILADRTDLLSLPNSQAVLNALNCEPLVD